MMKKWLVFLLFGVLCDIAIAQGYFPYIPQGFQFAEPFLNPAAYQDKSKFYISEQFVNQTSPNPHTRQLRNMSYVEGRLYHPSNSAALQLKGGVSYANQLSHEILHHRYAVRLANTFTTASNDEITIGATLRKEYLDIFIPFGFPVPQFEHHNGDAFQSSVGLQVRLLDKKLKFGFSSHNILNTTWRWKTPSSLRLHHEPFYFGSGSYIFSVTKRLRILCEGAFLINDLPFREFLARSNVIFKNGLNFGFQYANLSALSVQFQSPYIPLGLGALRVNTVLGVAGLSGFGGVQFGLVYGIQSSD